MGIVSANAQSRPVVSPPGNSKTYMKKVAVFNRRELTNLAAGTLIAPYAAWRRAVYTQPSVIGKPVHQWLDGVITRHKATGRIVGLWHHYPLQEPQALTSSLTAR